MCVINPTVTLELSVLKFPKSNALGYRQALIDFLMDRFNLMAEFPHSTPYDLALTVETNYVGQPYDFINILVHQSFGATTIYEHEINPKCKDNLWEREHNFFDYTIKYKIKSDTVYVVAFGKSIILMDEMRYELFINQSNPYQWRV